ncbi:zf-TFIIB domain-containing protein [Aquabacter cavernae]|uniref:TFIIB-type zinc ribbon-containing protein n=1 Tax=Aquabacter cavernae TaxID=2496029 RepID=UPI0013DE7A62|nr:zf-TFIIB domain-containing protein [Aquabacter cavernae]
MTNPAAGMPCPVCKVPLVMSERQGVEIDYCPQCRGVWLDRGEMDKIIERSLREEAPSAPQQPAPQPVHQQPQPRPGFAQPAPGYDQPYGAGHGQGGYNQGGYSQGGYGNYGGHGKPKRKKSFLEELFD